MKTFKLPSYNPSDSGEEWTQKLRDAKKSWLEDVDGDPRRFNLMLCGAATGVGVSAASALDHLENTPKEDLNTRVLGEVLHNVAILTACILSTIQELKLMEEESYTEEE